MKIKICALVIFTLIIIVYIVIVRCSRNNSSLDEIKKTMLFESSNYNLWYFDTTYDQYKMSTKSIIDEGSIDIYKMNEYKIDFKEVLPINGVDKLTIKIQISDVYYDKENNIKYIYTLAENTTDKEDDLIIIANYKYSFRKMDGTWKIYRVEKSSTTKNKGDNVETLYNDLDYLIHDNQPIEFKEEMYIFI